MSDSTTPIIPPVSPVVPSATSEPTWAKPVISIFGLTVFMGAFVIAYLSKDTASLALMMGAAISMGGTVVNYWLGSSSGSTKKTELDNNK